MHFTAEPDADGGISRGMKEKSGPLLNRPQKVLSRFMPVNEKLKQHKKGALREKNRRKNNKNIYLCPFHGAEDLLYTQPQDGEEGQGLGR